METSVPYGLRDIKLTPYTDALGTILADASVDLPIARTLSFSDTETFEELRGDDRVAAQHGNGAQVEWEMESGGLPFDAFRVMAGGTVVESGVTPSQVRVYSKKVTDQRPYFRIEGQVISDSGGDVHCIIYRAKATGELSGEFADGSFFLTSASGVGLAMPSGENVDKLYDFVQNETVTPFAEPSVAPGGGE
ncbi:major tail protein [Microbacterium phage Sparcetus]|nr:major tail protein [Microbacterium phage Sparcetus]